jgi:glycosyltransferase involved in cell wall biosynthesis
LHIFILTGGAATLVNFRGPLIKEFLAAGHRVTAGAGDSNSSTARILNAWGVPLERLSLARAGINPIADVRSLVGILDAFRTKRPDVVFTYQIKPVIYGSIAAWIAGVPRRYAMITGLGYAFVPEPGLKRKIVRSLALVAYWFAFKLVDRVIFQNNDDLEFFVSRKMIGRDRVACVRGSGVDLRHFTALPIPGGATTFLMIARLLRDKGVCQFVDAARIVKRLYPNARFILAGPFDPNPAAITPDEVSRWVQDGVIEFLGPVEDVRPVIANCTVLVLPSYYGEGIPRTILEAMAMGRAVITTDAPGCREAVIDGLNGYLVAVKQVAPLAAAAIRFIEDRSLAQRMGRESEERANKLFDCDAVARSMLQIMNLAKVESASSGVRGDFQKRRKSIIPNVKNFTSRCE